MYEESYRTPLLVRWPGVTRPGSTDTHLTQNLDLAPTFLELAGVKPPAELQGRSLAPLLRGQDPADWPTSIYYHFFEDEGPHHVPRHCGVRTARFKLIHFYDINEWEMYDLQADPDELNSVYDNPAYAQKRAELTAELQRLRKQFKVTAHADNEATIFQNAQQKRRDFMRLLGRRPSRWNVKFETISTRQFDGYTREHLAYEVGDRRIEAFLLLPDDHQSLHPAVLALHPGTAVLGSATYGKSAICDPASDSNWAVDLVRRGYVVLAPDRLGFESRRPAAVTAGQLTHEEYLAGQNRQLLAAGTNLMGVNVTEMIVAADYLAKRPDVHVKHIGVAGHGEGGLLATILTYVWDDIACTVSVDGTVNFAHALQRDDPRTPPPLLLIPDILNWGDINTIIAGIYPRPYLEISTDRDRSDHFTRARQRYDTEQRTEFLQHLDLEESSDPGSVTTPAYNWLDRWLKPE
jgi:dienelactone hydrolase